MPPTGRSNCGDTGGDCSELRRPHPGRARRTLSPRGGADQGRPVRDGGDAIPDHVRGPRHPRRSTRRRAPSCRAPYPGDRIRHRAPRRHLHRAHQRRGEGFQGRRHPGRRPVSPAGRGASSSPIAPTCGSRGSTCSPDTSSATNAASNAPDQGDPAPRRRAPVGPRVPEGYLVPCPETPAASWGGPNPEFASGSLRYEYSSLVTPRSVIDLDLDGGDAVLRKRQTVLGDYDPSRYVTEPQWAIAPDGTWVPMSILVALARDVARATALPRASSTAATAPTSTPSTVFLVARSASSIALVSSRARERRRRARRRWYRQLLAARHLQRLRGVRAPPRPGAEQQSPRGRAGPAGSLLIGAAATWLSCSGGRGRVPRRLPGRDARTIPSLTMIEVGGWGNPAPIPGARFGWRLPSETSESTVPAMLVTAASDPRRHLKPAKWARRCGPWTRAPSCSR